MSFKNKLKKIVKYTAITSAVVGITVGALLYKPAKKLYPYMKQDIASEVNRVSSPGGAKGGIEGLAIALEEHVKTGRDLILFAYEDAFDDKVEYDIYVDKNSNTMKIFNEDSLEKEIKVGTAQSPGLDHKEKFGQYVTPNGTYMVINAFNFEQLQNKFGDKAEEYYANGMLQLSGPWAPHIAIHGTDDKTKIGGYKSNGCINVIRSDMEWIMENVGIGSKVYVK